MQGSFYRLVGIFCNKKIFIQCKFKRDFIAKVYLNKNMHQIKEICPFIVLCYPLKQRKGKVEIGTSNLYEYLNRIILCNFRVNNCPNAVRVSKLVPVLKIEPLLFILYGFCHYMALGFLVQELQYLRVLRKRPLLVAEM